MLRVLDGTEHSRLPVDDGTDAAEALELLEAGAVPVRLLRSHEELDDALPRYGWAPHRGATSPAQTPLAPEPGRTSPTSADCSSAGGGEARAGCGVRRFGVIRRAEARDLRRLQDVERAAGAPFRGLGMSVVADDDPPALADLRAYQARGRAWVATDDAADDQDGDGVGDDVGGDDVVVAYLLLDVVDGAAHVEQVSVDPRCARRGLGRQLIDTAAGWALQQGLDTMTLTTFADVPWNAPYYARLGFAVVPPAELGPGLLAVRRHERELGLDAWPRVSMRRRLR